MTINPVNLGCVFFLVLTSNLPLAFSKANFKGNPDLCREVEIVGREEWRARPRWREWQMKMPVNDVIIQHTVSEECHTKSQCLRNLNFIQEDHVDYRDWGDIAYNFLVGGDGRIYEGRGWTSPGTHSINFNTNSLGIAFIGNYSGVTPNQNMIDAALKLLPCGVQMSYLTPTYEVHGHRDVACTESPGEKLYEIIRTWKNFKGGRLPLYDCPGKIVSSGS